MGEGRKAKGRKDFLVLVAKKPLKLTDNTFVNTNYISTITV